MKIAISGKANTGKNLTAEFFKDQLVQETLILAFADAIKNITLQVFPWADPNCLFGPSHLREQIIPKTDKTYRKFLTDFGTLVRSYYDLTWLDLTSLQIQHWLKTNSERNVIISDMRFRPEYCWAQQDGFYLIRIKRPLAPIHNDITETDLDHLSDDQFDYVINNDGSPEDLRAKTSAILAQIRAKN